MNRMLTLTSVVVTLGILNACGEPSGPGDGTSVGGPNRALSVEDALAAPERQRLRVRGSLVVDPTGVRLCDAFAESMPPQCPDGAELSNFDEGVLPPETPRADGARWVDHIELIVVREGTGLRVVKTSPN